MTNSQTIRISFTCSHCGSINELTASHVHEATVIHCSRCRASVAPLGLLSRQPEPKQPTELVEA
jgi:DNA-directed RNA polymerase subunit RPC12/RpoP